MPSSEEWSASNGPSSPHCRAGLRHSLSHGHPFILSFGIVFANVLLGINQGLAWSVTAIMKIDLIGPRQRGLAMSLNEAAGPLAVSLAALRSDYSAASYALHPHPLYLGIAFALLGLLLTVMFVRETRSDAEHEASLQENTHSSAASFLSYSEVVLETSWHNRTLFSVSQVGMINNLNDGMAWRLFPLYFATADLGVDYIGWLAALYPAVWGTD